MGDNTHIQWTNATWNPLAGCSKVSAGCKNCYAIRDAHRLSGNPNEKIAFKYRGTTTVEGDNWTGMINLAEDVLDQPLRWKRPRMIFVNSMSDLFHESVPDEWIDKIFAVMALSPRHTFQILTKRAERMRDYLNYYNGGRDHNRADYIADQGAIILGRPNAKGGERYGLGMSPGWPLSNVWPGVSVEDQKTADERIPLLLQTPAAVRWISAEPLLGEIDARLWLKLSRFREDIERLTAQAGGNENIPKHLQWNGEEPTCLHWVVVGGESGSGARPMHPDWARSLRDQCLAAGVPYFFKQWGAFKPLGAVCDNEDDFDQEAFMAASETSTVAICHDGQVRWPHDDDPIHEGDRAYAMDRVGKKAAGRVLDGRTWDEFPKEVRLETM